MAVPDFQRVPNLVFKWFDDNNDPANGYHVKTYLAGTTIEEPTYADPAGSTANPTDITLDLRGEANIFLKSDRMYKFVISDANDLNPVTFDNISGSGGVAEGGAGTGDNKVLVNAADAVADYLADKILAGANVSIDIDPAPTGSTMTINATNDKVKVNASDPVAGYLIDKLVSNNGSITIGNNGGSLSLQVDPAIIPDAYTKAEITTILADYLLKTGGTMTGALTVQNAWMGNWSITSEYASFGHKDFASTGLFQQLFRDTGEVHFASRSGAVLHLRAYNADNSAHNQIRMDATNIGIGGAINTSYPIWLNDTTAVNGQFYAGANSTNKVRLNSGPTDGIIEFGGTGRSRIRTGGSLSLQVNATNTDILAIDTSGNIFALKPVYFGAESVTNAGSIQQLNSDLVITGAINNDIVYNSRPNTDDEGHKFQINGTEILRILKTGNLVHDGSQLTLNHGNIMSGAGWSTNSTVRLSATEAVIELASSEDQTWGSMITLKEFNGTTKAFNSAWSIARKTSTSDNTLNFQYGNNTNGVSNFTAMQLTTTGMLSVDGLTTSHEGVTINGVNAVSPHPFLKLRSGTNTGGWTQSFIQMYDSDDTGFEFFTYNHNNYMKIRNRSDASTVTDIATFNSNGNVDITGYITSTGGFVSPYRVGVAQGNASLNTYRLIKQFSNLHNYQATSASLHIRLTSGPWSASSVSTAYITCGNRDGFYSTTEYVGNPSNSVRVEAYQTGDSSNGYDISVYLVIQPNAFFSYDIEWSYADKNALGQSNLGDASTTTPSGSLIYNSVSDYTSRNSNSGLYHVGNLYLSGSHYADYRSTNVLIGRSGSLYDDDLPGFYNFYGSDIGLNDTSYGIPIIKGRKQAVKHNSSVGIQIRNSANTAWDMYFFANNGLQHSTGTLPIAGNATITGSVTSTGDVSSGGRVVTNIIRPTSGGTNHDIQYNASNSRWEVVNDMHCSGNFYAPNINTGSLTSSNFITASTIGITSPQTPATVSNGRLFTNSTDGNKLYYKGASGGLTQLEETNLFNQYVSSGVSGIVSQQSILGVGAGTRTLSAGRINQLGSGIKIHLCGTYQTDATPGTATIRVKVGSLVYATFGPFNLDANITGGIWYIRGQITTRATGTSGTLNGILSWEHQSSNVAGSQVMHIETGNIAAFTPINLTQSHTFDVDATLSDAGSSIQCICCSIDVIR